MLIHASSSNSAKLRELLHAARESGVPDLAIEPLPGLQRIAPPEETGISFEENAAEKAIYYSRFTPEAVLADDSGLEVDALQGAPGVYSARYAGPHASDEENNRLLLRNLATASVRSGRFVSVVALAKQGKLIAQDRGTVEGEILPAPRGSGGFGYDPLFFYPPFNHSFAELTPEEKFSVSHRGNAFRALFKRWPSIINELK